MICLLIYIIRTLNHSFIEIYSFASIQVQLNDRLIRNNDMVFHAMF